jgi:tetratricopeptide (TPR) repeat protein
LRDPKDALGRSRCIKQIGMVYHERFRESLLRGEPAETMLKHAQAAGRQYLRALALCPPTALTDLGPFHLVLGNLYRDLGQTERAREHYEEAVQIFDLTGNRHTAGVTRFNMSGMHLLASKREATPPRRRDLLLRAQAYAEAALRDYQHYQGRAAAEEAEARRLLAAITQALA